MTGAIVNLILFSPTTEINPCAGSERFFKQSLGKSAISQASASGAMKSFSEHRNQMVPTKTKSAKHSFPSCAQFRTPLHTLQKVFENILMLLLFLDEPVVFPFALDQHQCPSVYYQQRMSTPNDKFAKNDHLTCKGLSISQSLFSAPEPPTSSAVPVY